MSKFTDKQLKAITFDDGSLVVSASAGSGKTSVMVERLIRLIVENRADVKEILAVTFTKLAAQEMKERLSKALIARIREGVDAERLKGQVRDLPTASISTIDSFLNSLVKKYFYLADVDSSYSIIADAEVAALKNSAISEVFEKLYETEDEDINILLNVFFRKRNDELLKSVILSLYTFLESEPDEDAFLFAALSRYDEEGLKSIDNGLIARFIDRILTYEEDLVSFTQRSVFLGLNPYVDYFTAYAGYFNEIKERKNTDALLAFANYNVKRPSARKDWDESQQELAEDAADFSAGLNAIKKEIKAFFCADFEDRLAELKEPKRVLESLIKVEKLFKEEYSRQKRDQNVLDYADVTRAAYKLLQLKEVSDDLKSTYKFIFVDEYQDTNGVQESIFKLLENNNLFLVGDVKQSIYGFRGCDSENFAQRIEGAEKRGGYVELDSNFRSSKSVIDTVNAVFSSSMTKRSMGLEYAAHPMVYGGLYGDYEGDCELFYFEDKQEKPVLDLGVYSVEKHLKAEKKEKVNYEKLVVYAVQKALKQEIYDVKKNEKRLATYKDIAVLNRTVKTGVDRVVKELEAAGIPTVSENKRTIETYPEIQGLINLLNCIINPDDDIALCGALKSPAGGFTDAMLKKIRDAFSGVSFYEAANKYCRLGDDVSLKLKEFFDYLGRIRVLSAFEGVATLIRRIIREKSYQSKLLKTPDGERKLERINVFLSQGYAGDRELFLEEFLEYLPDKLSSMTLPSSGGGNAVSVISMHGSKGLEYPIVIVAGVEKNWNMEDSRSEVFLARHGYIGLKSYNLKNKTYKSNGVREYVNIIKQEDNLQNELRLLYVALTRARCILYVVSKNQPQENLKKDILDAKKHLDFICQSHIKCTGVSYLDLLENTEREERRDFTLPLPNESLVEPIKKYVDYEYPYQNDTLLSLKRTVTEVAKSKADRDFSDGDFARSIIPTGDRETGNAYHRFLELLDFSKISDNGLIARLFEEQLNDFERKTVDIERIKRILGLNIFKEISSMRLYKEQPFIVSVPPALAGEDGEEDILLQGVIDLLCIDGEKAIIVDYKYSHKNKELLAKTYRKQLDLYAYAAEKALGVKVEKKVLVNLLLVEEITL